MATQDIDYAALAEEHGGSPASTPVDYEALAAEHGGTAAKPTVNYAALAAEHNGEAVDKADIARPTPEESKAHPSSVSPIAPPKVTFQDKNATGMQKMSYLDPSTAGEAVNAGKLQGLPGVDARVPRFREGMGDVMTAATPLLIPAAVAAPVTTAGGLVGGGVGAKVGGYAGGKIAELVHEGAGPTGEDIGSTAGMLIGAHRGAGKAEQVADEFLPKMPPIKTVPPVHVELEARAQESERAAAATQAQVDKYAASKAKGINPPDDVVKANEKAKTKAAIDRFHADTAKEAVRASKVKPAPISTAPAEVPTEDVAAQPSRLKPLGSAAPARPINVKVPGDISPEIIRQQARPATELPSQLGKIRLPEAEDQGVLIRPQPLLGEGQPARKINVKGPGDVAPEIIHQPRQPIAELPSQFGKIRLPEDQGVLIRPQQLLGEGQAPSGLAETLKSTEKAVEPLIKEVKAAKSTPVKPADLERQVREGLGGTELKPNVPLKEQVEKPAEKPEKKLSSDPRKAVLQKAGASDAEIASILPKGRVAGQTGLTRVEMSKLTDSLGVDLGDKAIGKAKGDIKAGTHLKPEEVLELMLKDHSPAEIAKAISEGKHLPTVSGGSQGVELSPNASGESSASAENISRVSSQKAKGIKTYLVDSRSGIPRPVLANEAADTHATGPYHKIEVDGNGKVELLESGDRARQFNPDRVRWKTLQ